MVKLRLWVAVCVSAAAWLLPASAWAVSNVTISLQLAAGGCIGDASSGMLVLEQSAVACDVEVLLEYVENGIDMARFEISLFGTDLETTEFVFDPMLNGQGTGLDVDILSLNADAKPVSGSIGFLTLIPATLDGMLTLGGNWQEVGTVFSPTHEYENHGSTLAAVPEPSSVVLQGLGIVGLAWLGRRRRVVSFAA